ncbi:MAG: hypothetical protein ABR863_09515 [Roseiarcus sp.]|jgi:hypothetical protein
MQRRRPGFADLTAAGAAAIAMALSLGGPALPQDAQSEVDAFHKKVDADVALYLQKRPVRPSPVFDAVSLLLETLGEVHAMAIDACEDQPDIPEWQGALPGLHENTIIALGASFTKGLKKQIAATPAQDTIVDPSLCLEDERRIAAMMGDLAAMDAALHKQGY